MLLSLGVSHSFPWVLASFHHCVNSFRMCWLVTECMCEIHKQLLFLSCWRPNSQVFTNAAISISGMGWWVTCTKVWASTASIKVVRVESRQILKKLPTYTQRRSQFLLAVPLFHSCKVSLHNYKTQQIVTFWVLNIILFIANWAQLTLRIFE